MLHTRKGLKQKLLSGGIWSFLAKVSASFLTIALAAIITRLLPPDDVGVFFLSYSLVVLLSFFARFGLDQFCVRYLGKELAEKRYVAARDLVNIVVLLVLGFSFAVSALLYLFSDLLILGHLYQDDLGFNIEIYLIIWLPVTAFQFLFAEIFRSYHNIKYASIFSGGTIFGGFLPSILFGIVIVTVYATESVLYLEEILQILFSIMIILLLMEYKILRAMINGYCDSDANQSKQTFSVKQILFDSYPFFIYAFSYMLLIHADTIILGFYEAESEVAIYNAATRIAKLVVLMYMIVNEVIAPVIVELNIKGEKEKLEEVLRTTATIAVIPSACALLFFVFFGKSILGSIYGDYYESGALLLLIMSTGQLISVCAGSSAHALNMMGFQKTGMYIALATSLIAILACILIAPFYGTVAVAVVIAVALVLKSVLSMLYVHKFTGLWTYANIFIGVKAIKKLAVYVKS